MAERAKRFGRRFANMAESLGGFRYGLDGFRYGKHYRSGSSQPVGPA